MTLQPEWDFESISSSGYENYLLDAQKQILQCIKLCNKWEKKFFDENNINFLNINQNNQQNNNSKNNQSNKEKENNEYLKKFYNGGLFLNMLFLKLEKIFEQSLEINLLVTGLFTKICYYPFPILFSFLLNNCLQVKPGIKILWNVITLVIFFLLNSQ